MESTETTQPIQSLTDLTGEKAANLLKAARQAVHNELFRAQALEPSQGGSTPEAINRQVNHTNTVAKFCQIETNILNQQGIKITEAEQNYSLLLALLHDVAKIAPERSPSERLLMHGWDSANWAINWLHLQELSSELILQIQSDIQSHMSAPFIENLLQNNPDSAQIPKWGLPETAGAAILLTADMLSPMVLSGPTPDQPDAGSFDRYFYLNVTLPQIKATPNPAQSAFQLAKDSLEKNVFRLSNPPNADNPARLQAAQIEKTLGTTLGQKALAKILSLEQFITDKVGWDSLVKKLPDGQTDLKSTQEAYYAAVFSWKQTNPLQLDFTYLENQ